MKVWIIYGYDIEWKEPYIFGVYLSEDKAHEKAQEMMESESFKWRILRLEEFEVEE